MVDRAESDNEIEPEGMEVDPELKELATKEIMLYFPLPVKNEKVVHDEPINEDLNPPSSGWTKVQKKNKASSKAAESSGIQGGIFVASKVKAPMKKRSSMVKPGMSFRDIVSKSGAKVVTDEEAKEGLNIMSSNSSSSNKESENYLAKKEAFESKKDIDMAVAVAGDVSKGKNLMIIMSESSEKSVGTGLKKRSRSVDDDNMEYKSAEEEGSISTAKVSKK